MSNDIVGPAPLVLSYYNVPNIDPFAFREAPTYLSIQKETTHWIQTVLVPWLFTNVNGLNEKWKEDVAELVASWTATTLQLMAKVDEAVEGVDVIRDEAQAAQAAAEAAQVLAEKARDLAAQYASDAEEIQDSAIATIAGNEESTTRGVLEGLFAPLAGFAALNSVVTEGRLSADSINVLFADKLDKEIAESGRLSENALTAAFLAYELVEKYGAIGDGVANDTAAVQAAIAAAATSGLPVKLSGVYRLVKPAGKNHFLTVQAGLHIVGPGTLKVTDAAGDYFAVMTGATGATDLSRVILDGITVDENIANNPVTSFDNNPRYAFFAAVGRNIEIRNCTFKNIDSINTVSLNGVSVYDARIQDNDFLNIGQSANLHDHSTIYFHGEGVIITGNLFVGVLGGNGATTAIETHGTNQTVVSNQVRNFYAGANITGVSEKRSDNITVASNVFEEVCIGIDIWSRTTGIKSAKIINNQIRINRDAWIRSTSDYARGIMIDPLSTSMIDDLSIIGNSIIFKPSVTTQVNELEGAGINLYMVDGTVELRNLTVEGNLIEGAHSAGIRLAAKLNKASISRNVITNPGESASGDLPGFYKAGVTMIGNVKDVTIADNQIFDTRTVHKVTTGIMTSISDALRVATRNNRVVCDDYGNVMPVTTTAGSGKTFEISEAQDAFMNPGWAKIGSEVRVLGTGQRYVQTSAPDGFSWVIRNL